MAQRCFLTVVYTFSSAGKTFCWDLIYLSYHHDKDFSHFAQNSMAHGYQIDQNIEEKKKTGLIRPIIIEVQRKTAQ